MNLGENIYRLRTVKNMSQGDLADALEVSRQSVSKWENNSAVPELDKLVKMAALFGVTLDTLVSGQEPQIAPRPQEAPIPPAEPAPPTSGVTAGIVLLCCALLICVFTGINGGILIGLPLAICGILCLCLKRRRGLWCGWVLLFFLTVWLHQTVASFQPFWYALSGFAVPTAFPSCLYQLLISLVHNALAVLLSVFTLRSYLASAIRFTRDHKTNLLLGWSLTVIPYVSSTVVSAVQTYLMHHNQSYWPALHYWTLLLTWLHLASLLTMLIFTVAKFRAGKNG